MFLYCTADKIGIETGGGKVTKHECQALQEFADSLYDTTLAWGRDDLESTLPEPWKWDDIAHSKHDFYVNPPKLAHFYAGTWGKTVAQLKKNGCKVSITVAAHDRVLSRLAHEEIGLPFPYPHLTEEPLWQRYIEGYRLADVIICPSTVAAQTVREYGSDFTNKDIRVVPHGCDIPDIIHPIPKRFVVGYMGSFGADKSVTTLLKAWNQLNYNDATLLLAGRDSISPLAHHLINTYGGGNIVCSGWVKNIENFYKQITLYVQPSATEGFGCEVLEAMAYGRLAIVSTGAGAKDLVPSSMRFQVGDVNELTEKIDHARKVWFQDYDPNPVVKEAEKYTWDKIRQQYIDVWKDMLQ